MLVGVILVINVFLQPVRATVHFHDLKTNARLFTLVSVIAVRWAYKSLAYEVCITCPKLIAACKIHCKSPSRQLDGLTMLDWFTVHEATFSAYIRVSAHVRSHVGCGRVYQTLPLHVPEMFQRRKSDANK